MDGSYLLLDVEWMGGYVKGEVVMGIVGFKLGVFLGLWKLSSVSGNIRIGDFWIEPMRIIARDVF